MKKLILLTSFVSIAFSLNAQNYFEIGTRNLLAGNCFKADSFLSLELTRRSTGQINYLILNMKNKEVLVQDVYYNRALARLCLRDTAGYCFDLSRAIEFGDNIAKEQFEKICRLGVDTFFLDRKLQECAKEDSRYIKIISREKYGRRGEGVIIDTRKGEWISPKTSNFIYNVYDGNRTVNMQPGWSGNMKFYSNEYFTTLHDSEWYTGRSTYHKPENVVAEYYISLEEDTVFTYTFSMPKMRGGYVRYNDFLQRNLKYPEPPKKYRLYDEKGLIVDVPCIITKEGKLLIDKNKPLEFTADLKNNELYAEAAMEVLNKMPKLKPARLKREKLDFFLYIPITFVFDKAGYDVEVNQ